jgi:hypothetical protein
MHASVQIDVESLTRSASGTVHGKLLLQIEEVSFPHPEWTDFVVVVLGWWCDAACRLYGGAREPIEVRFMEGPYLAELRSAPAQRWQVNLIEDGLLGRRVHHRSDVDAAPLMQSLLVASEEILEACKTRGWWSADADNLVSASRGLRSV